MRLFHLLALIVSFIFVTSCSENANKEGMPDVLRISILPDEGKETLLKRYTPLFKYLSDELDVKYKLEIPDSYQDLVDKFSSGKVDLAYFGGLTFIQTNKTHGVIPLVMRDVDTRFTSYFIAKNDKTLIKLTDFKNKRFSFGSNLSPSGHLMPRYFLKEKGIVPENYFSKVEYSGKHDKTIYQIIDGKVDLGATNAKIFDKMVENNQVSMNDVSIIWETPPYPDYIWVLRKDFDMATQTKIKNAFLSLSPGNSSHAEILKRIDANGFFPASINDFKQLYEISYESGLIASN